MTTLSIYVGYTKLEADPQLPVFAQTPPRYMGGFRVIWPDKWDVTVACDKVLQDTAEEAIDYATRMADTYFALLRAFDIIDNVDTVEWETISPPN